MENVIFCVVKIAKNLLRNQLSQLTLESVLMNATESPKQGFSKKTLEHFVDRLKRNPNFLKTAIRLPHG